jgi:hypothetical protein
MFNWTFAKLELGILLERKNLLFRFYSCGTGSDGMIETPSLPVSSGDSKENSYIESSKATCNLKRIAPPEH